MHTARCLALLTLVAACGSDDDSGGALPDGGVSLTCEQPRDSNAWFQASINPQLTSFFGVHEDHAAPQLATERQRVGDCALFAHQPSFCDPDCLAGVCIDGACRTFPSKKDGGTVTLEVDGDSQSLEQNEFGTYRADDLPSLAAGADLRITSSGTGDIAAFDIAVEAVAPISGSFEDLIAADGNDLTVTWDAAASDNPGDEIVVHLDSDHHGTAAFIECVVPAPATSVTIDKSLIDAILVIGESGIGTFIENSYIQRRNLALEKTATDCLSLVVSVEQNIFVDSDHGD